MERLRPVSDFSFLDTYLFMAIGTKLPKLINIHRQTLLTDLDPSLGPI